MFINNPKLPFREVKTCIVYFNFSVGWIWTIEVIASHKASVRHWHGGLSVWIGFNDTFRPSDNNKIITPCWFTFEQTISCMWLVCDLIVLPFNTWECSKILVSVPMLCPLLLLKHLNIFEKFLESYSYDVYLHTIWML